VTRPTNFELTVEFHRAIRQLPEHQRPGPAARRATIQLRERLLREEATEAIEALEALCHADTPNRPDLVEQVAKELADVLCVVYGAAAALGLPMDAVYPEVHASNMTKVGGPVRGDGKMLKGDGYRPPTCPECSTQADVTGQPSRAPSPLAVRVCPPSPCPSTMSTRPVATDGNRCDGCMTCTTCDGCYCDEVLRLLDDCRVPFDHKQVQTRPAHGEPAAEDLRLRAHPGRRGGVPRVAELRLHRTQARHEPTGRAAPPVRGPPLASCSRRVVSTYACRGVLSAGGIGEREWRLISVVRHRVEG
jgi:predicted HAD superfamily Cof-like phosphohydrolase